MTTATPAPDTPNRPAALNRTLLTLLGLILLIGGLGILVVGMGLLQGRSPIPVPDPGASLLPESISVQPWVPWLAIVIAVLIALLCLRWLLAQTSRQPSSQTWRLPGDTGHGTTTLDADTAADAFADEIASYTGIQRASAVITGSHAEPELHLTLTTTDHAPVGELRDRISSQALPRLRQAVELDTLPAELILRLGTQPTNTRTR